MEKDLLYQYRAPTFPNYFRLENLETYILASKIYVTQLKVASTLAGSCKFKAFAEFVD